MQTHYDILGVSQTASSEVIRSTYLRLLQIYHPDHNTDGNAVVMTRRIVEAYKVLGTPESRNVYDDTLRTPRDSKGTEPVSRSDPKPAKEVTLCCEFCGKLDPTLRRTVVFRVMSLLVVTKRLSKTILACERCRTKQVFQHTAATGALGWWGLPFGPIYTTQALYYNTLGGKSEPKDNAAILRLAGFLLYKEGRSREAKRAILSSLALEDDPDARAFSEHLNVTPSDEKSYFNGRLSNFDLANGACTAFILVLLGAPIYWYNAEPSGYEERYTTSSTLPQVSGPHVEPASNTRHLRSEVNGEADKLAELVEKHATVVGHHKEGTTDITDYVLDRSKYSSAEFKPLADRLQLRLSDANANADGFVSSTYFNARLMQLSIEIVNYKSNAQALRNGSRDVDSLAAEPQVAEWLASSSFDTSFNQLRLALVRASRAASEELIAERAASQDMDSMRAALHSLKSQAEEARQRNDKPTAVELVEEHDALVPKYNRVVSSHNSLLRATRRLDHLFNKCLDPSILMSKFQHVNITQDDPGDSPE